MKINKQQLKDATFFDYKGNVYTSEDVEFIKGYFFSKNTANMITKILYKKNEKN
jgi:hypothetical protein